MFCCLKHTLLSLSSWTDRVFGMRWLVDCHTLRLLHISPLPHHCLVLSEGEWTQWISTKGWKATIFIIANLNVNWACVVVFLPGLQIVQEYERAVIFRLGRITDRKAKGPGRNTNNFNLFICFDQLLTKIMDWGYAINKKGNFRLIQNSNVFLNFF